MKTLDISDSSSRRSSASSRRSSSASSDVDWLVDALRDAECKGDYCEVQEGAWRKPHSKLVLGDYNTKEKRCARKPDSCHRIEKGKNNRPDGRKNVNKCMPPNPWVKFQKDNAGIFNQPRTAQRQMSLAYKEYKDSKLNVTGSWKEALPCRDERRRKLCKLNLNGGCDLSQDDYVYRLDSQNAEYKSTGEKRAPLSPRFKEELKNNTRVNPRSAAPNFVPTQNLLSYIKNWQA